MVGKIHKYDRNEETGNLKCPYCEYETKKQNTMSEHVRRKHAESADRPIMANICRYRTEISNKNPRNRRNRTI
jgi:uncharacterized Zn finger protein (UPF0148 family)